MNLRRYGFATLISHDVDDVLIASHVPVLFDEKRNTLLTHLARQTLMAEASLPSGKPSSSSPGRTGT